MCGRFTLRIWNFAFLLQNPWQARFNIAPQNEHPIVVLTPNGPIVLLARWGWENPGRALLINARSETAADKPTFRGAFHHHRCLIPADGFYEWTGNPGDKRPIFFHLPGHLGFFLAGLWRDSGESRQFLILTEEANAIVQPVHTRMPVILPANGAESWLTDATLTTGERKTADALLATPVSKRVNTATHDDPDCLLPPEGPRGPTQLRFPIPED